MNLMQETLTVLDDEDDKDDKTKELPLGKETEANLFKSRSIFIYGPINQELAQKVCSQLVALAAASDEDIRIYVNSPGGHVESGDSIHDMVKFIKPKVWMIGTGWVASAGAAGSGCWAGKGAAPWARRHRSARRQRRPSRFRSSRPLA